MIHGDREQQQRAWASNHSIKILFLTLCSCSLQNQVKLADWIVYVCEERNNSWAQCPMQSKRLLLLSVVIIIACAKKNFTFNNVLELFSSSMHFNVYDGIGSPSLIFHLSISLRLLARVFSLFPLPILHFRYDFYVHVDGSFESFQSLVGLSRSRMWVWMAQRTENEISASSLEAATSFHNAHTTSSSSKILCSFNEKTTQRENAAN